MEINHLKQDEHVFLGTMEGGSKMVIKGKLARQGEV